MKHSERAQQVFAEELSWITRADIRQFVLDVFDRFGHDYFWQREASLSGKYHPAVSLGMQGLVRHVKLACWWGKELIRAHLVGPKDKGTGLHGDHVIAALILHDLMKEGDPTLTSQPERIGYGGNTLINGCHGVDLANAITTRMLNGKLTSDHVLILYGIACHMGHWTLPTEYWPEKINNDLARTIAQIVHMADYAASRKVDAKMAELNQQFPGASTGGSVVK
jgi:hypothetical protein